MKVRATRLGFYGNIRRRVGAEFVIEPHQFSKNWMEIVDNSETPVKAQPKGKAKKVEGQPVEQKSIGDTDVI